MKTNKTFITLACVLATQLQVAADVVLHSSFNKSLAAAPAGEWQGAESDFVLGVENKAIHLKGSQYISISGDLKFSNEEGSLHLWVKTEWPGNDGKLHNIVALGRKSGIRILKDAKNHLRFSWNPGSEAKQLVMGGSIAAEWPPNQWRHLAFTWKHGIYAVYLDGRKMQAGEPEEPVAPLTETTFLFLGGIKNAPCDYAVDEFVLCNHALTEEDVLKAFVSGMEHLERRDDPRLVAYAQINDKPAALILDTGSTLHALFRPFAIDAGVTPMASYRGGNMFNEEADATINLPQGARFKQRFIILKNETGFRHDGILGWMQFFSANRVYVEWNRRTLTLIRPEAMKSITQGWMEHSFALDGSQLRLPDCTIRIGEAEVRLPLIIDTGEGGGLTLTKKTWSEVQPQLIQAKRLYKAAWTPKSKQQTYVSFVPDSLQILGESMHGISVEENQHNRLGASGDEHASIGLAAVSFFDVVIDGVAGKLWLKPRTTPAIREHHDFSGILFIRQNEGAEIAYRIEVLNNSPAWELGLRTHDQIIEVDGQKPDYSDIDYQISLKDRLNSGEAISLRVRRGDQTFDVMKPKPRN